jgi:hypothetical protein
MDIVYILLYALGLECPAEEPYEDFDIEITESGRLKTAFRVPRFVEKL